MFATPEDKWIKDDLTAYEQPCPTCGIENDHCFCFMFQVKN